MTTEQQGTILDWCVCLAAAALCAYVAIGAAGWL
jgi:hypothetical protein